MAMPDASQTAQATTLCTLRRHAEEIVEIVNLREELEARSRMLRQDGDN